MNLSVYNEQLIEYGTKVYEKRKAFLTDFVPIFNEKYQLISGGKEKVNLHYKSQLEENSLADLLAQNLEKDKMLQYTSVGIHKDDLLYTIEGHAIKKFGSQGQQKSYLVALKLAQFDFIKKQMNTTPILLLDDIFDKLDASRVEKLIALVNDDAFGQVFITDTHVQRTKEVIKKTNQTYKMFQL